MLSCKIFKNTFLQNTSERLLLWIFCDNVFSQTFFIRGGSRAAATSKMERFVTLVKASGYNSHYLNTFAERVRDRYLKNNVSKSIIHVIKYINCQVYRAYPAGAIWKNLQFVAVYTYEFDFLFIKRCTFKIKKRKTKRSEEMLRKKRH